MFSGHTRCCLLRSMERWRWREGRRRAVKDTLFANPLVIVIPKQGSDYAGDVSLARLPEAWHISAARISRRHRYGQTDTMASSGAPQDHS